MKNSFLFAILIFCSSLPTFANAKMFGGVGKEHFYKESSVAGNYEGALNILLYNTASGFWGNGLSAPDFEVKINGINVARIIQNNPSILRSLIEKNQEIRYLKIFLPNGIYKISIYLGPESRREEKLSFEVYIKATKEISVVSRDLIVVAGGDISKTIGGLATRQVAEINEINYKNLVSSMSVMAQSFFENDIEAEKKWREDEQKAEQEKARQREQAIAERERLKSEERKIRAEKEAKAKNDAEKLESEKVAEAERRQREIELAKKKIEEYEAKKIELEDDKTCKSFGAKIDTPPYISCRVSLIVARKEQKERELAIKGLDEKINSLQRQLVQQEADRAQEFAKRESQRQLEVLRLQQQIAEERGRQEQAMREQRAERAFAAAAGLLQSQQNFAQPSQSPFHNYNINGRNWNCSTIGNITNCN